MKSHVKREADRHFANADRFRDNKDWIKAADSYAAGLKLDPKTFAMWVQYGHALKESGRPKEARDAYESAYRLDPLEADLNLQLGHLSSSTGDGATAKKFYARALELGSNDPLALKNADVHVGKPVVDQLCKMLAGRHDAVIREAWLKGSSFAELVLIASSSSLGVTEK